MIKIGMTTISEPLAKVMIELFETLRQGELTEKAAIIGVAATILQLAIKSQVMTREQINNLLDVPLPELDEFIATGRKFH